MKREDHQFIQDSSNKNIEPEKTYPIELQFIRGADYPAIFRAAAADEGKLTISKIYLDIQFRTAYRSTFEGVHWPGFLTEHWKCLLMAAQYKETG